VVATGPGAAGGTIDADDRAGRWGDPGDPGGPYGSDELDEAPAPARRLTERQRRWIGRIATFHFICVGWVFFRADSVGSALEMLVRMLFAWGPAPLVTPTVLAVIAGSLAVQFIPRTVTRSVLAELSRVPAWAQAVAFGAFLVLVDLLGPPGVAPFIYFQF
jgi:alginate O-acetyltransferase complex protein AlgI